MLPHYIWVKSKKRFIPKIIKIQTSMKTGKFCSLSELFIATAKIENFIL